MNAKIACLLGNTCRRDGFLFKSLTYKPYTVYIYIYRTLLKQLRLWAGKHEMLRFFATKRLCKKWTCILLTLQGRGDKPINHLHVLLLQSLLSLVGWADWCSWFWCHPLHGGSDVISFQFFWFQNPSFVGSSPLRGDPGRRKKTVSPSRENKHISQKGCWMVSTTSPVLLLLLLLSWNMWKCHFGRYDPSSVESYTPRSCFV